MSVEGIDRRAFLGRVAKTGAGAALVGATGTSLLGAASSVASASPVRTAPRALPSASLQLDWIEDIEFAGSYVAKSNGYYTKAGADVTLLAGGPSTSVEPVVVAGKALVGISGPDLTSSAIDNGAGLTIIGAQLQKAPQAMMSLAKSPIKDPKGMIGKKIGVQAGNLLSFKAFLKLQGIAVSSVDIVPVQFDPSPLAAGTVDGWYSFITNEPFLLAAKGVKTYTWLLYDYGYKLYSGTYLCRTSSLSNAAERAQIVAIMKGEAQGWEKAFADPTLAGKLTVDVYGKTNGLELSTQISELAAYKKLFVSPTTEKSGLFWMSPADVAANIATLKLVNIKSSTKYFTNEILQEVYKGKATV